MLEDKSSTCRLCGEEVAIRWINGRCVPLHLKYPCVPYSEEARRTASWVNCRECGKRCHFVRHKGGCVLLDDLGWPWPKHPCFAERFNTPVPRSSLAGLIDVVPNENSRLPSREVDFWTDPVFLESELQWFYTTLDGIWILPIRKGHFLKVQRTTDGWTLGTNFGAQKFTTKPYGTPQEAFQEAAKVFTINCKDLISQMKFERRSTGRNPTQIQWDLSRAVGTDSAAFRKLSRSGAQRFLRNAFSRKYHAKPGPPNLARNQYLRVGDPIRNTGPTKVGQSGGLALPSE